MRETTLSCLVQVVHLGKSRHVPTNLIPWTSTSVNFLHESYISIFLRRPLGGDAQLVAMLCREQLGGVIFFQDPLDTHPHNGDIDSLLRNTKIYNIMHASTTTSATMMMHTLRSGLKNGEPELLPSFFTTLQCPSVARYTHAQDKVIVERVACMEEDKVDAWIDDSYVERGEF